MIAEHDDDDYPELSEFHFREIFREVRNVGTLVSPRGQLVREVENYHYTLYPYERFCTFVSRRLNLDYVKREFLWYLRGDRFDRTILDHAHMWEGLVNHDGSINSNYGQYMFGDKSQFDRVVETLREDPDSRRASIIILNSEHLFSETKDVPCTYALNFRIRNGDLNMSVRMRSQDAIFGMGNDAPAFSFIHEMVLNALRRWYPDLRCGNYHHSADSFHVYERHFPMLDLLIKDDPYIPVDCPQMSGPDEVTFLRHGDFSSIPDGFRFSRWLTTFDR